MDLTIYTIQYLAGKFLKSFLVALITDQMGRKTDRKRRLYNMSLNREFDLHHDVSDEREEEENDRVPHLDIVSQDCIDIQQSSRVPADSSAKPKRSPPRECVFATLVSGGSFSQMQKFCANMDIQYIAKTTFYRVQADVAKVIEEYAKESMARARSLLHPESVVCADGRYPTRRNSSHCTLDIIDLESGKVLALGIVDKQSTYHPNEEFTGSSNMMETAALKRALQSFESFENLTSIVIDGDNKNSKVLQNEAAELQILRDPNHGEKAFERYITKEINAWKAMIPGVSDCFYGLRDKIKRWYATLINMEIPSDVKKEKWLNTVNHFLGDHSHCFPHEPSYFIWAEGVQHPEAAEKLTEILNARCSDFDCVVPGCSTQKNESFHQIQLTFGDKALRFPTSQITRDYLAVLHQNEGECYVEEIRKRLKLNELSLKSKEIIQRDSDERVSRSRERMTPEYRADQAKYRQKMSESHKSSKFGDYKNPFKKEGPQFI